MYYAPFRFVKVLSRFNGNWMLFFVNVLLVVVGYWIANSAKELYTPLKIGRVLLLLYSTQRLYNSKKTAKYLLRRSYFYVVPILGLLFLPSVILAPDPLPALFRLATTLIFLFYLESFFRVAAATQITRDGHFLLIEVFRVVYFLPLIIYFFNTPSLSDTNIYGEELGLVSNNFGWAASFYFLMTIDRIRNFPSRKLWTLIDLLSLPFALYLVIISGSRSSVLAIAVSIALLLLFRRNISRLAKAGTLVVVALLYLVIVNSQDLALNRKSERSGLPAATRRESRLIIWNDIFSIMAYEPKVLLFGVGPNNSIKTVNRYRNRFFRIHPHNTYIIVLFEGGIFCFLWFMVFFFAKPLLQYAHDDMTYFSYVLHPFVISFFDHNLGPGQFLAFPLFSLVFFYLYRSVHRISVKKIRALNPTPQ